MFLLLSDLSKLTLKFESLSSFKSKLIDILFNIYFYLGHNQDKLSKTRKVELTTTMSRHYIIDKELKSFGDLRRLLRGFPLLKLRLATIYSQLV